MTRISVSSFVYRSPDLDARDERPIALRRHKNQTGAPFEGPGLLGPLGGTCSSRPLAHA